MFFASTPNVNFCDFASIFIQEFQLKQQKALSKELANASENGEVLDLSLLAQKLEIAHQNYKTAQAWQKEYESKPKMPSFSTGIAYFDECLRGGLELGQLMILGGDAEAGKTTFGLQMLEFLSKKHKTCFFCFEFTIEGYLKSKSQKRGLNYPLENMIIINDGYHINDISQNIKNLAKQGVRFFLIDSQMRITNTGGRNIEEEESQKFSILARLCHSLNIFVCLIIQTAKGDRFNPSNSKKGAHEASISVRIEMLSPDKNDLEQKGQEWDENARNVLVYKNKQTGIHNKKKLAFSKEKGRFSAFVEQEKVYEVDYNDIKKDKYIEIVNI
ncbi:RAD55 family ATPase [Helicobacter sp. T3_23-1059]